MKRSCASSLPDTKATDSAFEAGDSFGIYAVGYDGLIPAPLQISGNWGNNSKATFNGISWTVSPQIWWKDDAKFDILAYYPFDKDITSIDNYIFEVKADQRQECYTQSDLMWAKATGVERSGGDIALNFKHKLSRLDINLIKGEDYEGDLPSTAEVRIMNTVTSAVMDLEKGETEKDPYGKPGTVVARQMGVGKFSAIIVPQKLLTQVPLVEIIVNNVSYLVISKFIFDAGVRHTLNVTLTSDPNKVVINIGGGIENWN
ncbi:MAG: fimbrillin family protein [Candidatus Cryptobacteroides sp.]